MGRAEAYLHGPIRRAYFARRIQADPVSRLAVWARRVAGFAVAVLLLAHRDRARAASWRSFPRWRRSAARFILAAIAVLLALARVHRDLARRAARLRHGDDRAAGRRRDPRLPGLSRRKGYRLPAIADITTDPIDPPRFEAIARLRSREANPIVYAGLRAAELQRAAYPTIEPLLVSATPQIAYDAARRRSSPSASGASSMRARRRSGAATARIEAVARTPILGFRDDVVVRMRSDPDGARVDIRSTSRYGRHDFGTNASRVERAVRSDRRGGRQPEAREDAGAGQEGEEDRPEGG